MQLFVTGLGETIVIHASLTDLVCHLKRQMRRERLTRHAELRLAYAGHELDDKANLQQAGLHEGSTVFVACKLVGGGCGSSRLFGKSHKKQIEQKKKQHARYRSLSMFDERDLTFGSEIAAERQKLLEMVEQASKEESNSGRLPLEGIRGLEERRSCRPGWKEMLFPETQEGKDEKEDGNARLLLRGCLKGLHADVSTFNRRLLVKILISATEDCEWEREVVMRDVVPFWQELCAINKIGLAVLDLRLGMEIDFRNIHAYDELVMQEMKTSHSNVSHLFHLFFVGQKYGLVSFPERIKKQKMDELLKLVDESADRKLVKELFSLDANQLSSQGGEEKGTDGSDYVLQMTRLDEDWRKKFDKIRAALMQAAKKLWSIEAAKRGEDLQDDELRSMMVGMIEREFAYTRDLRSACSGHFSQVILHRSLLELEQVKTSHPAYKKFVDVKEGGTVDQEAHLDLKRFLDSLPPSAIRFDYLVQKFDETLGLNPQACEEHATYLVRMCNDLCGHVSSAIKESARLRSGNYDEVEEEVKAHVEYVMKEAENFTSCPETDELMREVRIYLQEDSRSNLNILGPSGCGKTSLMCKLVKDVMEEQENGCVLVRVVGASKRSKTRIGLLRGICEQLRRAYEKEEEGEDISLLSLRDIASYFRRAVTEWPSSRQPLTIFIDGVDELEESYSKSYLDWLPTSSLPPHVRIVLTVSEEGQVQERRDTAGRPRDLALLCVKDMKAFVNQLLLRRRRRITGEQWAEISTALARREEACSTLWLSLVASLVQEWPSSVGVLASINPTLSGLLIDQLDALQARHGEQLLRATCSYLTLSSSHFLHEQELFHLLCMQDDVLAEAYFWSVPSMRILPPFLIKSLLHDARPLLYRYSDGRRDSSFCWRHVKVEEVIESWLFGSAVGYKERIQRHSEMADFFDGTWSMRLKPYTGKLRELLGQRNEQAGDRLVPPQPIVLHGTIASPPSERVLNLRRLHVLVPHLIACRDEQRAVAELCSLEYLTAKLEEGIVELLRETSHALKVFPDSVVALHEVKGFIGRNLDLWRTAPCPHPSFQLAFQEPDRSAVLRSFRDSDLFRGSLCSMLIEWLNKPHVSDPCVLTIQEHENAVTSVAVSPSGKQIASSSADGTVVICSTKTGEVRSVLRGHFAQVSSVCFSPSRDALASVGWDQRLCLWNVRTWGELGPPRSFASILNSAAFSPSASYIAVAGGELGGGEESIFVCYARTGELKASLQGHEGGVTCLQFHPQDEQVVASSSYDETVRIWSLTSLRELFTYRNHADWVRAVSFNPASSSELASAGEDRTVRVWEMQTGEDRLVLRGHAREIHAVAWTRDGVFLASGSEDKTIRLWRRQDGTVHAVFRGHEKRINSLCFNGDGRILVSGSSDQAVKIWVVDKERPQEEAEEAHAGKIFSIAFSHQEPSRIATCSSDATIQVWNFDTGEPSSAGLGGHTDYVLDVAFSPHTPSMLASCSSDMTVRLWDLEQRAMLLPPLMGHQGAVCCVLFHHSDPTVLASGSADGTVRVWDLGSGELKKTLRGHESGVASLACSCLSPQLLVSGGQNGKIKLWHFVEGSPAGADLLGHEASVEHLRFTQQGTLLSCCKGGWLRVWDVASSTCLLQWDSRAEHVISSDKFVLASQLGSLLVYPIPSDPQAAMIPCAFLKAPNSIAAVACSGERICAAAETRELLRLKILGP